MINKKEKEIKKLMKKRTLLSMLLAGIMAVSLVGCGDDGKSNNNNNITDKFQPTSTDTAVNGTESNTGDPVTPYEPGASGPTNSQVETPTPEPEKNVITLMSADGKKVIHEFDIPDGYTVVSDKKSNHVELAKDGDDTIKVEIISGPCAEYLSTYYQYVDGPTLQTDAINKYKYSGTYCSGYFSIGINEYDYVTKDEFDEEVNNVITESGIDKKYFTQKFDNMIMNNHKYGFVGVVEYPEQHSFTPVDNSSLQIPEKIAKYLNPTITIESFLLEHFDFTNVKENDTFPVTYYEYRYITNDYPAKYIPANEQFTIKISKEFNEEKYDKLHPYNIDYSIEMKISDYLKDASKDYLPWEEFLEKNFNFNTHKCDHCK